MSDKVPLYVFKAKKTKHRATFSAILQDKLYDFCILETKILALKREFPSLILQFLKTKRPRQENQALDDIKQCCEI